MNKIEKTINDKILIIADSRIGTYQQSIALAEAIGFEYELLEVNYNYFSKLPNFFLQFYPAHLDNPSFKKIKNYLANSKFSPKFIISSGRRTASIALWIKKFFYKTKIIQIMQPEINYQKFDLVILPIHDKIKYKKTDNLVSTLGAMNRINDQLILNEQKKFSNFFDKINKKIIVLLIGGKTKDNFYDPISIKNFCKQVSTIVNNFNCYLIILNSPRTSLEINEIIKNNLTCDNVFFDYETIKDNNPYLASLGYGDFFIAMGDSVSMISQCCSTGKPVFIFDDKKISSSKHRIFHEQLYSQKYALPFDEKIDLNNIFPANKLQEAKRISSLISSKF